MHIGIKNGNIVAFNETLAQLEVNATVKGITFDSIEETDEAIVPYYNTENDGIYYKESQIPPVPTSMANSIAKNRRRELYTQFSDPLTNEIAVLLYMINSQDYESAAECDEMNAKVLALHAERKAIREQIIDANPFITTV
jgi:hypothetical protein